MQTGELSIRVTLCIGAKKIVKMVSLLLKKSKNGQIQEESRGSEENELLSLESEKLVEGFTSVVEKQSKLMEVMNEKLLQIIDAFAFEETEAQRTAESNQAIEELKHEPKKEILCFMQQRSQRSQNRVFRN